MATDRLDHVQAVRSAYEAANSRITAPIPILSLGRWRITPAPLGRRG
jgi:hypothetical protein